MDDNAYFSFKLGNRKYQELKQFNQIANGDFHTHTHQKYPKRPSQAHKGPYRTIQDYAKFWHERAAFQSVGVRAIDWQRR